LFFSHPDFPSPILQYAGISALPVSIQNQRRDLVYAKPYPHELEIKPFSSEGYSFALFFAILPLKQWATIGLRVNELMIIMLLPLQRAFCGLLLFSCSFLLSISLGA